jgi:peptide/nickel transport system permease protein
MSVTEIEFQARAAEDAPVRAIEGRSQWRLTWQRLRGDKVAVASAVVIVIMAGLAIAAPAFAALTGHGPTQQFPNTGISATGVPVGPGKQFWLGADELGRDLFVRILYGARISLFVGVVTTVIGTVFGVSIGMTAGYYGGWIDTVLSRLTDAVLAFPYIILGLSLAVVLGPSLPVVIGVISFFAWAGIARVVRGQTLSLKEKEYIEAARSVGAGPWRIMFIDIMPNLLGPVLVLATLSIPAAIVFEATLSFLGLGVQPPTPSWGNLLAGAQTYYSVAWWYLVFPALALLITTLAFNLLGDGIRDALDPRTERVFAGRRRRRRGRRRSAVAAAPGAGPEQAAGYVPMGMMAPGAAGDAGAAPDGASRPDTADVTRVPAAGPDTVLPPSVRPPRVRPPRVRPPTAAEASPAAAAPAPPGAAGALAGPAPTEPEKAPDGGSGPPAASHSLTLLTFLARRTVAGIVVLWAVSLGAFLLFFTRPPLSVARQMAGKEPTAAELQQITRQLGLNQPIVVQYWHFLVRLLHGNLGYSYASGESVNSILAQDLPRTASVVVGGVVLWLIVGLGVGIISATRPRSLFDRASTVGVLVGLSLPTFVLGQLLLWGVFLQLNKHGFTWIQDGYEGPTQSISGWIGHMILPWIALATVSAAVYSRLSRGSLLDALSEDYIRTARAKGLSERRVVFRHGLRSGLTPVVSQLGIDVGTLLGGVVVIESVFGIGGIGSDSVAAIDQGNLPVIIGFVLVAAVFVVVANLIVDFCYTVLDPRVRIK